MCSLHKRHAWVMMRSFNSDIICQPKKQSTVKQKIQVGIQFQTIKFSHARWWPQLNSNQSSIAVSKTVTIAPSSVVNNKGCPGKPRVSVFMHTFTAYDPTALAACNSQTNAYAGLSQSFVHPQAQTKYIDNITKSSSAIQYLLLTISDYLV